MVTGSGRSALPAATAVALLLGLLAACGSATTGGTGPVAGGGSTGAAPSTPPRTASLAPTHRVPTRTPSTAVGAPGASAPAPPTTAAPTAAPPERPVLQRHDAPPSGVDATTTSYYGGAGGAGCGSPVAAPSVRVDSSFGRSVDGAVFGFGELFDLCIEGFRDGQDVRLTITGPDGQVDSRSLCRCADDAEWERFWGSFPGDPLGTYRLRAWQGATSWTGAFRVVPQHRRLMRVIDGVTKRVHNRPGDEVRIVVAGFSPTEAVGLNFYFDDGSGAEFVTQVRLHVGADGVALYRLRTSPRDPKGCYVVHTSPAIDFNTMPGYTDYVDGFCLS